MGIRTARVIREAPEVRELFYGDGVYCSRTKRCAFQTYILDNKANESVIDKLLCSKGIKLMISPTGERDIFMTGERNIGFIRVSGAWS